MTISEPIYITDNEPWEDMQPVRISASRGRSGYKHHHRFRQIIEMGGSDVTNSITSVQKDNILWIEREASDRP